MHVLRKLVDLGAENCGVLFYIYTYVKTTSKVHYTKAYRVHILTL